MKSHQQGFIPLVAIILLGITAVVGGTIATVSIHKSAPEPVSGSVSDITKPANTPALAPVSGNVDSSTTITTNTSYRSSKSPVGEAGASIEKQVVLDTRSKEICSQIAVVHITSKQSLTQDIQALCGLISSGHYQEADELETATARLQEKWNLWLKTQKGEESAKTRAADIEAKRQ